MKTSLRQKISKALKSSSVQNLTGVKSAHGFARDLDARLRAGDFERNVTFVHRDGSICSFENAFAFRWKQYTMIFTEHHRFHVHPTEDLLYVRVNGPREPIEKL